MVKPFKSKAQAVPQPTSTSTHVFSLMVALDDYTIDGINSCNEHVLNNLVPALLAALHDRKLAVRTTMRLTEFMDKNEVCPDPVLLELRT